MAELSAHERASLCGKLDLPDDATDGQILEATDVLIARARAKEKGTVGKSSPRASLGLADSDSDKVVASAVGTLQLRAARRLGLSAATPPKSIMAAVSADNRVRAMAAPAAAAPTTASAPPAGRVAAATAQDLTGAYALNPLVAQTQADGVYASAYEASGGAVPTLFRSGDLPAFTASGVEPGLLRNIPWAARHALAAEPDRARVLDLFEQLSGPDADLALAELANHDGNKEYTNRVVAWKNEGWDLTQRRQADRHAEVMAAQQQEVRAALGDPEEWTDEQLYEHLFGEMDRQAEEKVLRTEQAILEGRVVGHGRDLAKVRASVEERVAASAVRKASSGGPRVPNNVSKSIDYSKVMGEGA
jgi:hypothetical protein